MSVRTVMCMLPRGKCPGESAQGKVPYRRPYRRPYRPYRPYKPYKPYSWPPNRWTEAVGYVVRASPHVLGRGQVTCVRSMCPRTPTSRMHLTVNASYDINVVRGVGGVAVSTSWCQQAVPTYHIHAEGRCWEEGCSKHHFHGGDEGHEYL